MPLVKGAKPGSAGFRKNIKQEIAAGKPQKQAVAIAYSESRQHKDSTMKHEHPKEHHKGHGAHHKKEHHKKEHHAEHADHKHMHTHHKEMHKHHMKEVKHHEKMMHHHMKHTKKK